MNLKPGVVTWIDPNELDTLTFWRGSFGDDYSLRNAPTDHDIRARTMLWAEILKHIAPGKPKTILEVGANIGNNLRALRSLSGAEFYATEPNDTARKTLIDDGVVSEWRVRGSAMPPIAWHDGAAELVFSSGVLIHVPPDQLLECCKEIYRCSTRWIVAIEYFSDAPREVPYRGHTGKLWTRDFGAFYLDHFPNLKPVACGFAWRRMTGLDNLTYWVFEKRQ